MFRRRREKKALKGAEKKRKAEEKAADNNIQLLRVAPRGTQYYGGESPDFPLAMRNVHMSQSMDVLNRDPGSPLTSVHPADVLPPLNTKNNKKKKKGLRRVQSLAEDGMLGQMPLERYHRHHHDAPVYYETSAPMYVIDERRNGDLHVHPTTRPRYVVSALPLQQQRSLDNPASPGTPVLYHHPQNAGGHQHFHAVAASPTTPPSPYASNTAPTAARAARHRNYVHVIPKPKNTVPKSSGGQRRPVSHFYSSSAQMRSTSTPLRTPSPMRSPSPAIYNTGARKGKGKAIKVVEGWDEPEDETPRFIQSHEVGVAPKSKVMDDFNSRAASSPFSITISNDDPSLSSVERREPSRRNKARPVSAAPWISGGRQYENGEPITRQQNGHMVVDFTK